MAARKNEKGFPYWKIEISSVRTEEGVQRHPQVAMAGENNLDRMRKYCAGLSVCEAIPRWPQPHPVRLRMGGNVSINRTIKQIY